MAIDDDLRGMDLGPKMLACSEQERKFVLAYMAGDGDATAAARLAGYVDTGTGAIRVRGHHLIHRDRVLEALEEISRKEFRGFLMKAIIRTRQLLDKPDHPDHARTVSSMLSRLGYGEKASVDVNVRGEVTLNHTDAAVEDLRVLREMGVSREKLLETFGYSGLERYERMLEERTGRVRRPVLIEAKAEEVKGE